MTTNGTHAEQKTSTALAVPEYEGLTMVVSPKEALRRIEELQAFVKEVMKTGLDYGVIPGTGQKPTLLQPGAQKLCEIYGFAVSFEDRNSIEDWERGLFVYKKKCVLTSRRDGRFIGDGIGSCNSKEDRYAWRWTGDRNLPKGIDKSTLKSRQKNGKTGSWTEYRLPNDDIFSIVNTVEKMAAKRALIHAVIGVTRSSGIFTQDVEDLPADAFGEAEATRSWEREDPEVAARNKATADMLAAQIQEAKSAKDLGKIAQDIKAANLPEAITGELRALFKVRKAEFDAAEKAAKEKPEPIDGELVDEPGSNG